MEPNPTEAELEPEPEAAAPPPSPPAAVAVTTGGDDDGETAESVEAWLDSAIAELTGALEAAGRLVEAGKLDPNVPTLKLQALVARMMGA